MKRAVGQSNNSQRTGRNLIFAAILSCIALFLTIAACVSVTFAYFTTKDKYSAPVKTGYFSASVTVYKVIETTSEDGTAQTSYEPITDFEGGTTTIITSDSYASYELSSGYKYLVEIKGNDSTENGYSSVSKGYCQMYTANDDTFQEELTLYNTESIYTDPEHEENILDFTIDLSWKDVSETSTYIRFGSCWGRSEGVESISHDVELNNASKTATPNLFFIRNESDLKTAIENSSDGDVLTLANDISISSAITITDKQLTITGGTRTLSDGTTDYINILPANTYSGTFFNIADTSNVTFSEISFDGQAPGWYLDQNAIDNYKKYLYSFPASSTLVLKKADSDQTVNAVIFKANGNMTLTNCNIRNFYNENTLISSAKDKTVSLNKVHVYHNASKTTSVLGRPAGENSFFYLNEGTVIEDNYGAVNGGIIRSDGGNTVVLNGAIVQNNTTTNSNGSFWMGYGSTSTLIINSGSIRNNLGMAGSANGRCGVIYLHSKSKFEMNGGYIENNVGHAYSSIDAAKIDSILVLNKGVVRNNTSLTLNYSMYIASPTVQIGKDMTFVDEKGLCLGSSASVTNYSDDLKLGTLYLNSGTFTNAENSALTATNIQVKASGSLINSETATLNTNTLNVEGTFTNGNVTDTALSSYNNAVVECDVAYIPGAFVNNVYGTITVNDKLVIDAVSVTNNGTINADYALINGASINNVNGSALGDYCRISFNVGGGTNINNVFLPCDTTYLTTDIPQTVKEGCNLVGWYTDSDFSTLYQDGNLSQSATLYAKWDKYYLHVMTNEPDTLCVRILVDYNTVPDLSSITKEGYEPSFYTNATLTTALDVTQPITADVKVYVKWTAVTA